MQLIDLNVQQARIRKKIDGNIKAVLASGRFVMGPGVTALEERLARYAEVKHAVACASGGEAMRLALMVHGVAAGDAVFTSPFSYIAAAEVIACLGATPVLVDIDPATFTLSPEQLDRAAGTLQWAHPHLTPAGVVATGLFGLPADHDAVRAVAERHGLFVIEDATQSFGAAYKGRPAGSLADIACTSFAPAMPLGCYGDGGMCFTDDDRLAAALASLCARGRQEQAEGRVSSGIDGRLDPLQAAVLHAKLDVFPQEMKLRRLIADYYDALLHAQRAVGSLRVPEDRRSAWAQYPLLAGHAGLRAEIVMRLAERGITAAGYAPPRVPLPATIPPGLDPEVLPVSADFAARIFTIPMHPYLDTAQQERVGAAIRQILARTAAGPFNPIRAHPSPTPPSPARETQNEMEGKDIVSF